MEVQNEGDTSFSISLRERSTSQGLQISKHSGSSTSGKQVDQFERFHSNQISEIRFNHLIFQTTAVFPALGLMETVEGFCCHLSPFPTFAAAMRISVYNIYIFSLLMAALAATLSGVFLSKQGTHLHQCQMKSLFICTTSNFQMFIFSIHNQLISINQFIDSFNFNSQTSHSNFIIQLSNAIIYYGFFIIAL